MYAAKNTGTMARKASIILINSAIFAADPGDEIFIKAGLYRECVHVDKQLTIYGEVSANGQLLTVLDGCFAFTVITLWHDDCQVRDLIIQNAGYAPIHAGVVNNANYNSIFNCIFRFCENGILIKGTIRNSMCYNVFYHNSSTDIRMEKDSELNFIRYNEFQSGNTGMYMIEARRNYVLNCLFSVDLGLLLEGSTGNIIYYNEFVCDSENAQDDTGGNTWRYNGWSDYDFLAGSYDIPGPGGDIDPVSHIALSQQHTAYGRSPTITVPDRFLSIQAAVDAAVEGDRIFVKAGIYFENIEVKKRNLTIFGELDTNGKLITIVDGMGSGQGFNLLADSTKLYNFIIQNTGFPSDIGIIINSDKNIIMGCLMRDCGACGIKIGGDYCSIKNNVFYRIPENCIETCACGPTLGHSIGGNEFHAAGRAAISLHDVFNYYISNNVLSTRSGIFLISSENNLIRNNRFTCNSGNTSDNMGHTNNWDYNRFSDYDGFSGVYAIPAGVGSDPNPSIAYSFMY